MSEKVCVHSSPLTKQQPIYIIIPSTIEFSEYFFDVVTCWSRMKAVMCHLSFPFYCVSSSVTLFTL